MREEIISVGIPRSLISRWNQAGGDIERTLELQQEILGYVSAAYEEWSDTFNHEYED